MKNKNLSVFTIALLALVGLSSEAEAYPMFAKQTGMDCTSCHMQHMPKLNSTGRMFALSGMTMSQKLFDKNSSGVDMNPSIMLKSMYQESFDKPNKKGNISTTTPTLEGDSSIPKTASLLVGGRVSSNVGALIDLSYKARDEEENGIRGKIVYAEEIDNGYIGAVAHSTPYFGPFSGMENYNTGLNKPLATFDMKKYSNAFQVSHIGSGEATGVQVYLDRSNLFGTHSHIFATVGAFSPAKNGVTMEMSKNILGLARIAYEYPTENFNFILGGFGIYGGGTVAPSEPLSIHQNTYGIDFQLEGTLWDKSVSLVMSKVLKNKVTYTGLRSNSTDPEEYTNLDNKAFSVEGEVNLIDSLGIKMAYMTFDDASGYTETDEGSSYVADHINVRDIDHAYTVGVDYSFKVYLPMKIAIEHAWVEPSLERMEDYREVLVSLNILY